MALICSCGTALPDNASFCHNCGKPQRELTAPEPAETPPQPAPLSPGVEPAVHFGNPLALRTALLWGSISALLRAIPIVNLGCCVWVTGAGFGAAYTFSRRAGAALAPRDGARLGWMTGLLGFVINLALDALNFAILRASGRNIGEMMREAIAKMPMQDESARQMMERFLSSPGLLGVVVFLSLVMTFFVTIALAMAGGALGAKVLEKE